MKKFAFGFAAAVVLGLASLSAPASAAATKTSIVAPMTDVSSQGYVSRRTVIRRGPGYGRGPVCTVRKVVRRGPMGRRVVSTTRVCR
ncbi:MAG: hypothetical protein JWR79_598 [Tardiphaga sp.]|nr:hypothetical protein [Tardiphaga sp.]